MSRRISHLLLQAVLLLLCLACAPTTKISASKNPSYNGKVFRKLLIEGGGSNIQQNIQLEWTFRSLFDEVRIPVANASQLFPPTANDSPVDRAKMMHNAGIDGVLLVDLKNFRKDTIYHPPTSTEQTVHRRKNGTTYVTTTSSGDYTEHVEVQDHGLTLLDAQTQQPVWVGNASTSGDFQNNDEKSFFRSLALRTVKDLAQAGLITLGAPLPKK